MMNTRLLIAALAVTGLIASPFAAEARHHHKHHKGSMTSTGEMAGMGTKSTTGMGMGTKSTKSKSGMAPAGTTGTGTGMGMTNTPGSVTPGMTTGKPKRY